jgi:ribose transport system substrate-binding protein
MKKMRMIISIIIVTMLVFALVGCASEPSDTETSEEETNSEEKIVIGSSMVTRDNQWWANVGDYIEEYGKNNGYEVVTIWANNDQEKQIRDVEDLVQREVDLILLGPVQVSGSSVAVDTAAAAGIPIITVARESESDNVTAGIVFDEKQFGINQAEQIMKDFPDGANIVYLYGPVGAVHAEIQYNEGFVPMIEENDGYEILQMLESKTDTAADGLTNAEDALIKFDNIDAIACTNDDLALGAIRALEAAGRLDEVNVYGNSGLTSGMQAIVDGQMFFTNLKSQPLIAVEAFKLGLAVYNGEPYEKENFLAPIAVNAENALTVTDAVFGGTLENPSTFQPE